MTEETYVRTIKVPLETPTANKAGRINWAMKQFQTAREYACEYFEENDPLEATISDRSSLYKELRPKANVELPANVVTQAVNIVHQNYCEYALGRADTPPEATNATVYGLHAQVIRLFYDGGTYYLNLSTGRDRFSLPLRTTDRAYHADWLPYPDAIPEKQTKRQRTPGVEFDKIPSDGFPDNVLQLSSSTLHRTGRREYVAHLVFKRRRPEQSLDADDTARYIVGVDRGRNQLAYAALYDRENDHVEGWWNRSGDEVRHYMDEYAERIREFQEAGVWEQMEDARDRRYRYKNQVDYEIANGIADLAGGVRDEGVVIAIEDLSGMSRLGNYAAENRRFSEWSYSRQAEYVEDKADEHGVNVVEVDAAYTSQQCSRCGTEETVREGVHFECEVCGYSQHADANAAVNIAKRAAEET